MHKRDIERRTKFTTNTYMKEAINYDIRIIKEGNLFITIKKYQEMTSPFSLINSDNQKITYIDEGYYVIELTPIDEFYNIRFYVDPDKNIIEYYIDITLKNGIKYKIPYYVDLYLDIVHYPKDDSVTFYDEDELLDALNNKIISKKDYDLAYKVGHKLLKEIKDKTNKYLNMDILKYIK